MTGTGAADAVTAGTPLNARTANIAPMVMSIFLIVIISLACTAGVPGQPVAAGHSPHPLTVCGQARVLVSCRTSREYRQ